MRVAKITRLKLVVTVRKYFIQLLARFSSRQDSTIGVTHFLPRANAVMVLFWIFIRVLCL